jgi:hypothetical protein
MPSPRSSVWPFISILLFRSLGRSVDVALSAIRAFDLESAHNLLELPTLATARGVPTAAARIAVNVGASNGSNEIPWAVRRDRIVAHVVILDIGYTQPLHARSSVDMRA